MRSKKDVEGNLIKCLYVIKRDSVKEGDNVGESFFDARKCLMLYMMMLTTVLVT